MTRDREADQRLLDAVLSFVAGHPHPALQRFKPALADWGEAWTAVAPSYLPAVETLQAALPLASSETRTLAALVARETGSRRWEQSYRKTDGLVGDDMLSGYGFVEVIGTLGPFVSNRVRAGVGVWGPSIAYPPHRHQAEEVYVPLAGSAEFRLGEGDNLSMTTCGVGDAVYVPSLLRHGFRTKEQPLVVFYIWQAGDLRETSSFS